MELDRVDGLCSRLGVAGRFNVLTTALSRPVLVYSLLFLSLGVTLFLSSCGSDESLIVEQNIGDAVWSAGSRVELKGTVLVSGTLKVEAGVEVLCSSGSRLVVGRDGSGGRLEIRGTADKPVVFRSKSSGSGWSGIEVFTSSGNEISHCRIEGVSNSRRDGTMAALKLHGLSYPVRNVRISCHGDGIRVNRYGGSGLLSDCYIETDEGHALVIPAELLSDLGGVEYQTRQKGYGVEVTGGRCAEPVQIAYSASGNPLYVSGSVVLDGEAVILENVRFYFEREGHLKIGEQNQPFVRLSDSKFLPLSAVVDEHVTERGVWGGVYIYNCKAESVITNCTILGGGLRNSEGAGLHLVGQVRDFSNNTISYSQGVGLLYTWEGLRDKLSSNGLTGNGEEGSRQTRGVSGAKRVGE